MTWNTAPSNVTLVWRSVYIDSVTSAWTVGDNGIIGRTTDAGLSWSVQAAPFLQNYTTIRGMPGFINLTWASGDAGGFIKYSGNWVYQGAFATKITAMTLSNITNAITLPPTLAPTTFTSPTAAPGPTPAPTPTASPTSSPSCGTVQPNPAAICNGSTWILILPPGPISSLNLTINSQIPNLVINGSLTIASDSHLQLIVQGPVQTGQQINVLQADHITGNFQSVSVVIDKCINYDAASQASNTQLSVLIGDKKDSCSNSRMSTGVIAGIAVGSALVAIIIVTAIIVISRQVKTRRIKRIAHASATNYVNSIKRNKSSLGQEL